MRRFKNLIVGLIMLLAVIAFDRSLSEGKMSRFKQAVIWWVIIALLIIICRTLVAQATEAMKNQCSPAMVGWVTKDSLKVTSFSCIDFRNDSLILIPHIVNGEAKDGIIIPKSQVRSITLLKPEQKADFKPRA